MTAPRKRRTELDPNTPPAVATRIFAEESGDLRARLLLNRLGSQIFEADPEGIPAREAMCSIMHAQAYLADREAYAENPWPKNTIPIEW